MPNPRAQKNANLRSTATGVYDAVTQGLLPLLGNAARGSVATTLGTPGDILGLLSDKQPLPTSQNILDYIPAVGNDKALTNMAETMGGFVPSPGAGGAVRAAKTAVNPKTYGKAFVEAMAPGVMSRAVKAPRQEALDIAQRNAALPVEKGGLGLPMDNTPMDRAAAMGGVDVYHGTGSDIASIDPSMSGINTRAAGEELGFFTTSKPDLANHYAELAAKGGWHGRGTKGSANVMPLVVFPKNSKKYETASEFYREADKKAANNELGKWRENLRQSGFDSVQVRPDMEEMVMFNPSAIRSRFAAFDPFRKNENDLLASRLLPFALPGLLYQGNGED